MRKLTGVFAVLGLMVMGLAVYTATVPSAPCNLQVRAEPLCPLC